MYWKKMNGSSQETPDRNVNSQTRERKDQFAKIIARYSTNNSNNKAAARTKYVCAHDDDDDDDDDDGEDLKDFIDDDEEDEEAGDQQEGYIYPSEGEEEAEEEEVGGDDTMTESGTYAFSGCQHTCTHISHRQTGGG